jgi:hypothetical protein
MNWRDRDATGRSALTLMGVRPMLFPLFLQDLVLRYLVRNKAPSKIRYTSSEETKVFGFWVYITDGNDTYVINGRIEKLCYECLKVDAPKEETGKTFVKSIGINGGVNFARQISVKLFYDGLKVDELKPLTAFLYGITRFYVLMKWLSYRKWQRDIRRSKQAFKLYSDRFALLETIISVRNKQFEEKSLLASKITSNKLIEEITGSALMSAEGFYTYLEPILKGLNDEKIISLSPEGEIEVLPKAWFVLSEYYIQERRHKDNQKALFWQRVLTGLLIVAALAAALVGIFQTEIRSWIMKAI